MIYGIYICDKQRYVKQINIYNASLFELTVSNTNPYRQNTIPK